MIPYTFDKFGLGLQMCFSFFALFVGYWGICHQRAKPSFSFEFQLCCLFWCCLYLFFLILYIGFAIVWFFMRQYTPYYPDHFMHNNAYSLFMAHSFATLV